jgi:hypothetical protein
MNLIDQRLVHPERGDCMRCCLASLLDVPYEKVPDLAGIDTDGGPWFVVYMKFLKDNGFEFVGTYSNALGPLDFSDLRERCPGVNGLYMAGGPSFRYNCTHAIIIDGTGKMIHDPHPSRAGIKAMTSVDMIQKIQPQGAPDAV